MILFGKKEYMIKRSLLTLAFIMSLVTITFGQAGPTSRLAWDIVGPSLSTVQAYTWRYYADQAIVSWQSINNVICTGTSSPFTCTAPFPSFTPGQHRLQITANAGGQESAKSAMLNFLFSVTIGTPTNLRLAPAVPE